MIVHDSNNADPREGIKTTFPIMLGLTRAVHSNNADPREGIKTFFNNAGGKLTSLFK